jgi:hypothetical protein
MFTEAAQTQTFQFLRSTTPVRNWCSAEFHKILLEDASYWSLNRCIKEAAKYPSREAWERGSFISYQKAIKRGWLTKCTTHIKGFHRKPTIPAVWTIERCISVAQRCASRKEFKNRFGYPYEKARLNRWLEVCCAHMDNIKSQ